MNDRESQIVPNLRAYARSILLPTVATSLVLNSNTTMIEVSSENQGVYIRYNAGVTSGNFDAYVLPGQTRHYPVSPGQTISFLEKASGAIVTVIELSL